MTAEMVAERLIEAQFEVAYEGKPLKYAVLGVELNSNIRMFSPETDPPFTKEIGFRVYDIETYSTAIKGNFTLLDVSDDCIPIVKLLTEDIPESQVEDTK